MPLLLSAIVIVLVIVIAFVIVLGRRRGTQRTMPESPRRPPLRA